MTLRISEIAVQMKVAGQDALPDWSASPSAGAASGGTGSAGTGSPGSVSSREIETLVERCTAEVLSRIRLAGER